LTAARPNAEASAHVLRDLLLRDVQERVLKVLEMLVVL
jgi:hypothetical protein